MPRGKADAQPSLPGSGASNGSFSSIESKELPYFYSNFSNTDEVADFLLHKSGSRTGFFLVRPSFKNRSLLTVSVVVSDKTVRHTNIIIEGTAAAKKYFLVKEKKFDSVDELIRYYKEHDVKNLQKVNHVRFAHPLNRSNYRSGDSNSSAGSYSTINSQNHSSGSFNSPPQNPERPPLPARPTHLQRLGSQDSFGSQMSVFTQGSVNSSSASLANNGVPGGFQRGNSNNSISPDSNWTLGPENVFPNLPSPEENISRRPPAPIPQIPNKSDGNPYYSSPRNVDESIKEELKKVIRESERCDCGIPRELADLPLGWTVHRSKDVQTYGRIFYQNDSGVTCWKLPEDVNRRLTAQHRTNLQKVKIMKYNDDYLESNVQEVLNKRSQPNHPNSDGSGGDGKRFSNTQF